MKPLGTNVIALLALFFAVALMVYLFAGSRNDPSLRIAALVAGTGLVSSLAAIASTILTGKDVTKPRDPSDMPPNSTATDTSIVKVGPIPNPSIPVVIPSDHQPPTK
jgi:hypothetical protein